ncbi:DUF1990 family protein [Leifsonia sp. H3M29-4]|uniref:DUF1990 family protein n=1 Tax=Salinibacterium metalliresistens TaxID=3031321 RepID=UPI0023DA6515|nr:DUF1990 family protein [Salinibacterium metalliresistens]MDF1480319.1 DUF1990 family protein [Salinibacterium metalliresistens]
MHEFRIAQEERLPHRISPHRCRVENAREVADGERLVVTARLPFVTVREPVEVVTVVREPDRVGFSYRALPGHPIAGEEASIVHRDGDDVLLTIRSLTAPSPRAAWRVLYPVLRVAQVVVRRRYRRALTGTVSPSC